jgi:hypothetical protein
MELCSFATLAMQLKDLQKAIHSALRGEPLKKMAAPEKITMTPKIPFKATNFTLPSTYEDNVFPLLNLPLELVKVIIAEVATIEGPYRSVRLRTVNSKLSLAREKVHTLI